MRAFLVILLLALTAASAPGASTGEHRLKTSDGIELWYRVAGARDGIPVLFLHGGGQIRKRMLGTRCSAR